MHERLESGEATHAPSPLPFFSVYLVAGVAFWFALKGGLCTLIAPLAMTFVAVPVFDALMGLETRNPSESSPGPLATALFRLATWLALPAQGAVLLWGLSLTVDRSISAVQLAGAAVAVGITGGVIGITVAHELVHRSSRFDRAVGG